MRLLLPLALVVLVSASLVHAGDDPATLTPLEIANLKIAKLSDDVANLHLAVASCEGQLKAVADATFQAASKQRYAEWIKSCEDTHVGYRCAQDGTLTKKADTK